MTNSSLALAPATVPAAPGRPYRDTVAGSLASRQATLAHSLAQLAAANTALADAAARLVLTLRTGHKVLVAGNGGSAAEAQHFAAELVGRFKRERLPYAVIALTTDSSILTAVANDYGYEHVFSRQVAALGQPGDLLLAFSTSGASPNVIRAAETGRARLMTVVAVTGHRRSPLTRLSDIAVRVPVSETEVVQELHMIVTHILCDIVESELASEAGGGAC
ncbi:MAG TPA: SIS domain-containing protein [Chloroflexota bacterium]|nr:SIS domain-containing protein [Chloroflexota bacterium]